MFSFFFAKKDDLARQNSLAVSDTGEQRLDNFLSFAKSITEKRKQLFDELISFALESNQWGKDELAEKNDKDDRALVFNFSGEYVERYMARLFPRNAQTGIMDLGVKVHETNHQAKEKYEKEIFDIYRKYDITSILLEQGLNFLAGGAGCLYYPRDGITKRASIFSLDPRNVFLGWSKGEFVQFAYREYIGDGKYNYTYWDLACCVIRDGLTGVTKTMKNEDGFIPFSWIPNFPKPHSHEGCPKTDLLYELDKEYNAQASNYSKRVAENTEPHLVVMSDSVDIKNVDRGKNKKTRLGQGDDMKYLELKEGTEIMNWLEKIEKRISGKTGLINSAGEIKTHMSGTSLSYQYGDMMDLIGFMRIFWDKGIRNMNNAILTYKFGVNEYQTDPVYQPFIQQDFGARVDQYDKMLKADLITHLDAIDELRGVENAEEKLAEILAEKETFNKLNIKSNGQEPVKPVQGPSGSGQ
jgi:hypothetical protein